MYIRHYCIPEDERSHDHSAGNPLDGVSVYPCEVNENGRFRVPDSYGNRQEIENLAKITAKHLNQTPNPFFPFGPDEPKHIFYLVEGNEVDVGPDSEPLIGNVRILNSLIWDAGNESFRIAGDKECSLLAQLYPNDYQSPNA